MMRMLDSHRISSGVRALLSHLETPLVGSRKTGMEWVFFIGYTIVGMGDKWWSYTRCEWRYNDYDIVPNLQFKDDMQKKGVVKFEKADYVKNAADAGVSLGLYIFMSTFDTFVLKKGGKEEMMTVV